MLNKLFFELLRVAVGTQVCLSVTPSAEEWSELLRIARVQALVGVCFAGVQRLERSEQLKNLPSKVKLQWLAMALQIQRRNEVVNKRCEELSHRLTDEGFRTCLLKGQGIAELYKVRNEGFGMRSDSLAMLRQSGDIDMWMVTEPKVALDWARKTGKMKSFDYHHADVQLFPDVEVELHYRPSVSRNLVRNVRLQRWFRECGGAHVVYNQKLGCYVPDWTFNVVLSLNHIFCHLMFEGVGLRQLMDLYFVLRNDSNNGDVDRLLKYFGLLRFAGAVMWVEHEVFGLRKDAMLCEPDERSGRILLDEIMRAGNFGHHDDRLRDVRSGGRVQLMCRWMRHSMRLFGNYPADVLWTPVGVVWISMWRRLV